MHLRKFEVFSFNHGSNLYIVLGFTQLFRCERENVRWGFYKREKTIKMKNWIFHPRWEGAGSTEFQILYCFFFLHWRERARFPSQELRGDFLAMAFLAFRACFLPSIPFLSRFLGEGFLVCVCTFLDCNFPKGFSRLHFVRAILFFLQQRFQRAFPSARFQHVSFSKVPACFLPARFCVCVSVGSAMSVGIFLGQHF